MNVDIGLFADCHFHAVCGGIVIPGQDVCDTCRTEWGQLLQPARVTTLPIAASAAQASSVPIAERRAQSGQITKPGQTCWMCERRRACVKKARGWECDDCLEVV